MPAQAGAGFDIVSQGELERVILAGGDPAKVVFSGVQDNMKRNAPGSGSGYPLLQCRIRSGTRDPV